MIEVKSIEKTFSNVKAVNNISFNAKPGEIFALIGPNGAGKSTTIRMIMNIIAPDNGEILFEGKPIQSKDKDRIGYLPEERGLPKKQKVMEALLYFASLKGAKESESKKEILKWLDLFELSEWQNRKVEELSKGMAQKIQFIGAVAHKPSLVFFDEPFSGLDPVSQEILLKAMLSLKNEGKTILFSTHVMEHAEKIAESILLINKGKEVLSGPVSKIKSAYGKNSVRVEFDGNADFVKDLPFIKNLISFPREFEAELIDDASPDLLFSALSGKIKVRKYEIMEPSLHKIFVNLIGNDNIQEKLNITSNQSEAQ